LALLLSSAAGFFLCSALDSGTGLILFLAAFFLMFLGSVFLIRFITMRLKRHIGKLSDFAQKTADGHLEERMSFSDLEEFNALSDHLNNLMENMGQLNKARSDFLSRMSHEIRTPINAITGMSQIARATNSPAKIQDCMVKIEESSRHLLGIINDIIDFSKLEANKLVFHNEIFSLKHDLDFISSLFSPKASATDIKFSIVEQGIQHDGLTADILRLNQVLINLLSNAFKFTAVGGIISLSVEELFFMDGEAIYRFTIKDNGIGIESEQAKHLFTPFVQANTQIAGNYGGTGLGLVISKNIVELMGGEIELDTAPGRGSAFSFTIRVKAEESSGISTAELKKDINLPDFTGKRLLIVDDIEINREICSELLKETGIKMESAENGKVALEKFEKADTGYFDMIFMDMQMPVMDGCTATEKIRHSEKPDAQKVKIIAMTANVMQEDVQKVYDSGMDGYIAKPIDISEVYQIMTEKF
jgi:signal transduction histidine kinase/CheY-like chemotaxis protein